MIPVPHAEETSPETALVPVTAEKEPLAQGEMSLFDHLKELRKRLVYSLVAVGIGFSISWIWRNEIFEFILVPLKAAAPTKEMAEVHFKDLIEPFFTLMKTCFASGVLFAIPVILWQAWKFIAPGLYAEEKRMAIPFVLLASAFFIGGTSFCYYFVMPIGFEFLFKFAGDISSPMLMMQEHYNLALKLLLAFGLVFEMPVVAMFLSAIGVITHHTLIKHWRISVVVSFILAAILTPPDVGTQIAMAIPLVVLYGVSILVALFFTKRREKKAAA